MSSNRYQYFRWTRRTALITFNYVILVPAIIGVAAYATDVCPDRPASGRYPRDWWTWKADCLATTAGQVELQGEAEGRPACRVLDRWCIVAIREDLYITQAETRRRVQNTNYQPTLRFVLEDCYNRRPSHQNSMPNKMIRDIMIQQFRASQNTSTPHRIVLGQPIEGSGTASV